MSKKIGREGVWIPIEVWEHKELTLAMRAILVEIVSLNRLDNGCIASNSHFAEYIGMSKATAERSISSLVKGGWVKSNVERDAITNQVVKRTLVPTSKTASVYAGFKVEVVGNNNSPSPQNEATPSPQNEATPSPQNEETPSPQNEETPPQNEVGISSFNNSLFFISSKDKDIVQSDDCTMPKPVDLSSEVTEKAFEAIWDQYPKRNGAKGSKAETKRLCFGICSTREDWERLYRTVRQYRLWADHNNNTGTTMVMQTTTFFGKKKQGYLEDWSITPVHPVNNNGHNSKTNQSGMSFLNSIIGSIMDEQDQGKTSGDHIEGEYTSE